MRGIGPSADTLSAPIALKLSDPVLPAGRYRVTLLAEGSAVVNIPVLQGADSMALRPDILTDAAAKVTEIPIVGAATVPLTVRAPIRQVTADTFGLSLVYMYVKPGITVTKFASCFEERSKPVTTDPDCGAWGGPVLHPAQDAQVTLVTHYDPGTLQPGIQYDALHNITLVSPMPTRAIGAYLLVDMPPS
jgi:hypothetical protein